jgi:hypothetical protein
MKGDAITRPDAARRQSAREAFGFGRKPLVSPDLFVKDECRAFLAEFARGASRLLLESFSLTGLPADSNS